MDDYWMKRITTIIIVLVCDPDSIAAFKQLRVTEILNWTETWLASSANQLECEQKISQAVSMVAVFCCLLQRELPNGRCKPTEGIG
ncbi:hypothetical protein PRIPAC_97711 [Pristionchus pacificus]|uniref:Uncharacterized protein n=1 Tax=Pristionchus pacificus TaxID=54126 RepID=A0A2A6CUM0_PRIPA|nr:hypothetical protein PRIPAC_97711 [Pristionchus pacificus]|eukprot:PDM81818.1 hypothetical protein PRIPAC_33972 [Pristionchus pacificus]